MSRKHGDNCLKAGIVGWCRASRAQTVASSRSRSTKSSAAFAAPIHPRALCENFTTRFPHRQGCLHQGDDRDVPAKGALLLDRELPALSLTRSVTARLRVRRRRCSIPTPTRPLSTRPSTPSGSPHTHLYIYRLEELSSVTHQGSLSSTTCPTWALRGEELSSVAHQGFLSSTGTA